MSKNHPCGNGLGFSPRKVRFNMVVVAMVFLGFFLSYMYMVQESRLEDSIVKHTVRAMEERGMVFCEKCKYYDNGVAYIDCTCPAHIEVRSDSIGVRTYRGDCVDYNAKNDCPNYVKKSNPLQRLGR